jgi:hypothetical protein
MEVLEMLLSWIVSFVTFFVPVMIFVVVVFGVWVTRKDEIK